jgi:hypothetical protein
MKTKIIYLAITLCIGLCSPILINAQDINIDDLKGSDNFFEIKFIDKDTTGLSLFLEPSSGVPIQSIEKIYGKLTFQKSWAWMLLLIEPKLMDDPDGPRKYKPISVTLKKTFLGIVMRNHHYIIYPTEKYIFIQVEYPKEMDINDDWEIVVKK